MTECGNQGCGVSTGIHEGLTFGSGQLDFNGYWENPCPTCARKHEEKHPEDAPCWPFVPNYVVHFNALYRDPVECKTPDEVWDTIGEAPFGSGYQVESPAGLDIGEFIPF